MIRMAINAAILGFLYTVILAPLFLYWHSLFVSFSC